MQVEKIAVVQPYYWDLLTTLSIWISNLQKTKRSYIKWWELLKGTNLLEIPNKFSKTKQKSTVEI